MARVIILLYGAIAYLAFLATFLYAIGFVGNLAVPKSIDTGPAAVFAQALVIDLVLLGLFAVQHSTMARQGFKRWWTKLIPSAAERSTFVLVSSLLLALIYWQWRPISQPIWNVAGPGGRALEALFWGGWLFVFISSFAVDHFDLFGLRQVYLNFRGIAYTPPPFRLSALYRYLRHPLLAGFIVAFWATPLMTTGHLLFAAATSAYIVVGIMFEERDLTALFGEPYRQYRRRVWALVPLARIDKPLAAQLVKAGATATDKR